MTSERIADGNMEGLTILETSHIKEAALASLVGHMKGDTPVDTDNQEVEIVAQADTCADGELLEEILHLKLCTLVECSIGVIALIILEVPHVTYVEEHSAVEVAEEFLTILQVGYELEVTILYQIGTFTSTASVDGHELTRSDATHGEGTDTVGTTYIEQFTERSLVGVTIGCDDAQIDMSHQLGVGTQRPRLGEVGLYLQELRVRIVQQFLVLLVPLLSTDHITQ